MTTETGKPSDWALYRRLLGYVARHGGAFLLSILGFLIYSVANVEDLILLVPFPFVSSNTPHTECVLLL